MSTNLDHRVRLATFDWLEQQVRLHGDVLTWAVIKQGVPFEGQRIPLISQQGIFKPRILPELPLSITTSPTPASSASRRRSPPKQRIRG